MKNCKFCGEPIPATRRKDSKFCCNSCKAKYFELHGKANKPLNVKPLSGIHLSPELKSKNLLNPDSKNTHQPNTELNEVKKNDSQELPPLKNLYKENNEPTQQKSDSFQDINLGSVSEALLQNNKPLPPQFITKTVERSNPQYTLLEVKINSIDKQIENTTREIKALKDQITQVENDTGNAFVIVGALAGYGVGHLIQEKPKYLKNGKYNTKWKLERERIDKSNSITKLLTTAIGALLGAVAQQFYKESQTVTKAQALAHYNAKLNEVVIIKNKLEKDRSSINWQKFVTDSHLVEFEEVPNPEYNKQLQEQEKANTILSNISDKDLDRLGKLPPEVEKAKNHNCTKLPDFDENSKIQKMKDVASVKRPRLDFTGKWLDFFGIPQTNFFCVIHGMSGEGKTNFSIQFAKYLAETFGNVLFVSGEEGFNPTFQQKIKTLGADAVPNLYAADLRTGEEILTEVTGAFHFIFIDSVNNMDIDPELMKEIRQKFPHSAIIAICQSTKDGKMRGSYQLIHDCDIAVKVVKGIAVTIKNRFAETMKEFDVFEAYGKPRLSVVKSIKPNKNTGDDGLIFRNTI